MTVYFYCLLLLLRLWIHRRTRFTKCRINRGKSLRLLNDPLFNNRRLFLPLNDAQRSSLFIRFFYGATECDRFRESCTTTVKPSNNVLAEWLADQQLEMYSGTSPATNTFIKGGSNRSLDVIRRHYTASMQACRLVTCPSLHVRLMSLYQPTPVGTSKAKVRDDGQNIHSEHLHVWGMTRYISFARLKFVNRFFHSILRCS